MSESSYAQKHTLLCLRLAAECRDLAAAAFTPVCGRELCGWPTYGRTSRISPLVRSHRMSPKPVQSKDFDSLDLNGNLRGS